MSEPPTSSSSALRSAREALVAQLLGDVDRLLLRVETLAPSVESAAARLEVAAQGLDAATHASSAAAKASVGEYITRRTNEAVIAACEDVREGVTRDARLPAYRCPLDPRIQALVAELNSRRPSTPPRHPWLACLCSAALGALLAITTMLVLTRHTA